MKLIKKIILAIIILVFTALFLDTYIYNNHLKIQPSKSTEQVLFIIEKNSYPVDIAKKLKSENLIVSERSFLRYIQKEGIDTRLQAGRFLISKNFTIPQVAEKLSKALKEEIKITFPEGLSIKEMDMLLSEKGIIQDGEFTNCAMGKTCDLSDYKFLPENPEGYFFPDTYIVFVQGFNVENLARKMLNNFDKKTKDMDFSLHSMEEVIIMASILEKETRTSEERPMVADIFWRRLEEGIPLGADATIRFFTGKKFEDITVDDLKTDNPYNTRLHKGLPPTAICNPSLESIQAVLNPKSNDYWYFLHGSDGQIYYAKT